MRPLIYLTRIVHNGFCLHVSPLPLLPSLHHLVIHYIIWLFTTSSGYSLHDLVIHYIIWLFTTSSGYSLHHLVIHYMIWLFTTSSGYSLHHLVIHYIIWLFTTSSGYSLHHLVIHYIIWLFTRLRLIPPVLFRQFSKFQMPLTLCGYVTYKRGLNTYTIATYSLFVCCTFSCVPLIQFNVSVSFSGFFGLICYLCCQRVLSSLSIKKLETFSALVFWHGD